MRKINAASPATSGKNKGNVNAYVWPTAIKVEDNATGLPVNNGKVTVSIAGDAIQVSQFDSFAEIESQAGAHFQDFVLDVVNARLAAGQLQSARSGAAKLTLAPADVVAYAAERIAAFDVASLWTPTERTVKTGSKAKGITADLRVLSANVEAMSHEDLVAAIMAMSAKIK